MVVDERHFILQRGFVLGLIGHDDPNSTELRSTCVGTFEPPIPSIPRRINHPKFANRPT